MFNIVAIGVLAHLILYYDMYSGSSNLSSSTRQHAPYGSPD